MRKLLAVLVVILMLVFIVTSSRGATLANPAPGQSNSKPVAVQPKPSVAEAQPSWHDLYPDYYKVRMASATDGWIVGQGGAIRRYIGTEWVAYASPVTATLHSVYPISGTAWAVGDNNTVLQFSNDTWQVTPGTPSCTNFRDVWMVSPSDGWAVGATCEMTPTGVIAHYDGSAWQPVSVPYPLGQMNALQMLSANEGWFVGSTAALLHYTNGAWQANEAGISTDLYSIAMLADGSEGWAGTIGQQPSFYTQPPTIHYAYGGWSTSGAALPKAASQPNPCDCPPIVTAYGVAALSQSDRWIVGRLDPSHAGRNFYYTYSGERAGKSVYTNDPNKWAIDENPNTLTNDANPLYSVAAVTANDVWAVGASGNITHFDGSTWTTQRTAPLAINGLAYANTGELIQVGNTFRSNEAQNDLGAVHVSDAVDATSVVTCTTPGVVWNAVAALPSSDLAAWAAGSGTIYYSSGFKRDGYITNINSSSCDAINISPGLGLNAVAAMSPTLAVAAGEGGRIAVYNGTWQTATLGTATFSGLAYSGGRYWAVGLGGTIYTTTSDPHNPANWSAITADSGDDLYAVSAVSNDEAWAVGNGVRYQIVGSIATRQVGSNDLRAVFMRSATDGWAVGRNGAIEHYDGNLWASVSNGGAALTSITFSPSGEGWIGGNEQPDLTFDIPIPYMTYFDIPGHLLHFAPTCYDYYTDVSASYFARQYILDLSCRGIVSGMGNHIFSPAANASRIQFAKIITLARGWSLVTPTTPTFSDVPSDNPLYAYVETAYANNALSGATQAQCQARNVQYPCFFPNDPVTRAQTAVITVRAYGWPIDTTGGPHFSDVSADFYAYNAIETAYHRGLVSGIGGGLFAPNAFVTRAQIAKIVDLALGQ